MKLLFILTLTLAMSACGQKGDLYFPKDDNAKQSQSSLSKF